MTLSFAILAVLVVAASVAAMCLRNVVHCALALVVAFVGLAAVYLNLGAQFVGFAQILVYVGAVAILVVFAILLTRGGDAPQSAVFSRSWVTGLAVATLVLAVLVGAIARSEVAAVSAGTAAPDAAARRLGEVLMERYVLPLEAAGLLLTAALIGAVLIAMREK